MTAYILLIGLRKIIIMLSNLSILIPTYNSEKTIARCLNSLLASFKVDDLPDIVIFDDFSTDNTLKVIEQFKNQLNIFVYVSDVHQGIGVARRELVKIAKTEYITFIDSDDYVVSNYASIIYGKYDDYDMSIFGFFQSDYNCTALNNYDQQLLSKRQFYNMLSKNPLWGEVLWNKVFKTSILKSVVYSSAGGGEDIYIIHQVVHLSKTMMNYCEAIYIHDCVNSASITNSSSDHLTYALDSYLSRLFFMFNNNYDQKIISDTKIMILKRFFLLNSNQTKKKYVHPIKRYLLHRCVKDKRFFMYLVFCVSPTLLRKHFVR